MIKTMYAKVFVLLLLLLLLLLILSWKMFICVGFGYKISLFTANEP